MEETPKATGFGGTLKQARESAGVSLRELSNVTKIQIRYIEALEAEQWKKVPGGIIGRGFVRLMAREVGGDVDHLVELYQQVRGEEPPPDMTPPPESHWRVGPPEPKPWLRMAGIIAVLLVGMAAALFVWSPWSASPEPVAEIQGDGQPHTLEIRAVTATNLTVRTNGQPPEQRELEPAQRVSIEVDGGVELELADGSAVRLTWDGEMLKVPGEGGQPVTVALPGELETFKP